MIRKYWFACFALGAVLAEGSWAQDRSASFPPPSEERFQQDVAWSPNGQWIAFSEYPGGSEYDPKRWAIRLAPVKGGQPMTLIENAQWVSWAPDGRRLAFGSQRDGNWEIYTIGADGEGLVRLTRNEAQDRSPAWSPDGNKIAFTSDRDGNKEIWVMDADGSNVRRLTDNPSGDYNPAWSPDGRSLAFYREKGDGQDDVLVTAADGSGERAITDDARLNTFPSFLPDGRIAFASKEKDGPEILVCVEPDGGGRKRVGDVETFFARWSPDGQWIAFISGPGWPQSAIYLMKADGSGIRKLVN